MAQDRGRAGSIFRARPVQLILASSGTLSLSLPMASGLGLLVTSGGDDLHGELVQG